MKRSIFVARDSSTKDDDNDDDVYTFRDDDEKSSQAGSSGGTGTGTAAALCMVCGDKSSGYHYGVQSCNGCKSYFPNSIRKQRQFKCIRDGNCHINPQNRKRCQYCRFKKCLAVGMSLAWVRQRRAPKRPRINTATLDAGVFTLQAVPSNRATTRDAGRFAHRAAPTVNVATQTDSSFTHQAARTSNVATQTDSSFTHQAARTSNVATQTDSSFTHQAASNVNAATLGESSYADQVSQSIYEAALGGSSFMYRVEPYVDIATLDESSYAHQAASGPNAATPGEGSYADQISPNIYEAALGAGSLFAIRIDDSDLEESSGEEEQQPDVPSRNNRIRVNARGRIMGAHAILWYNLASEMTPIVTEVSRLHVSKSKLALLTTRLLSCPLCNGLPNRFLVFTITTGSKTQHTIWCRAEDMDMAVSEEGSRASRRIGRGGDRRVSARLAAQRAVRVAAEAREPGADAPALRIDVQHQKCEVTGE